MIVLSNSYAGITSTTALSFTTADVQNPTLSSSSPADNATDVARDANIVLNFSESVDVKSGNITIKKTSDDSTLKQLMLQAVKLQERVLLKSPLILLLIYLVDLSTMY